jgi:hypothetical protein
MSDTPESNKAKIAFTSLFANDDAYWVPFKVSCKLERERDETKENLKITQDAWIRAKVERVEALCERDEARETAERYRLEANAMMMQRDRLVEAIRKHRDELELTSGDSVDRILWNTLAAVKGENDE